MLCCLCKTPPASAGNVSPDEGIVYFSKATWPLFQYPWEEQSGRCKVFMHTSNAIAVSHQEINPDQSHCIRLIW